MPFCCANCACLGICSCLATTGGSLAKMSCRMERNPDRLDLWRLQYQRRPWTFFKMFLQWSSALLLRYKCCSFCQSTHIISPIRQIWMVYFPFPTHILPRPDYHICCRCDKADGTSDWVFLRHPYRDWKCVRFTSERDGQYALHIE